MKIGIGVAPETVEGGDVIFSKDFITKRK